MKFSLLIICIAFGPLVHSQATQLQQWQTWLDSVQQKNHITGIMIHVDAPDKQISWTGATGVCDIKSNTALTGHEPVRIASITKSFVATSVLRLWEEKRLQFSDPIVRYISEEHRQLLVQGGYHPEKITIRHLLSHTSGLFDHGSSPEYIQRILADPQHHWTRTEQISGAITWGKPVGLPGERFSYSDTGYILLGEIIERITGKSLGVALHDLINYEAIGLDETWFETTEAAPQNVDSRAHQYLDTIDTYAFDPSLDLYGGGGIVTTMQDLTQFYRGLFTQHVYKFSTTLDTMLTAAPRTSTESPKLDYRKGIWYQPIQGQPAYTHSGFWGVQVFYLPALNTGIAIAVIRQDDFPIVKTLAGFIVGDLVGS